MRFRRARALPRRRRRLRRLLVLGGATAALTAYRERRLRQNERHFGDTHHPRSDGG